MLSVSEALTQILSHVLPGPCEEISLDRAAGRILGKEVLGQHDVPPFNKALMDGFAVHENDLADGTVELKVGEVVTAGQTPRTKVEPGFCVQIMTGAPVPDGTSAIVPVEQSRKTSDGSGIQLDCTTTTPGQHVLGLGELIRKGDSLMSPGQRIRAQEFALLAEQGIARIPAAKKPTVGILATGDELVPVGEPIGAGQIRNSNEPMLAARINALGGEARPLGIARDTENDLREHIERGLKNDFLLLSGGVSAGERDLVPQVLNDCGVTPVFHKVRVKPGKPVWFGVLEKQEGTRTYVFGLPGNPVSSLVCCELFVKPALKRFLRENTSSTSLFLPLEKAHVARGDRPTYYPGRLIRTRSGLRAEPVSWGGSSDLLATTKADCLILFPAENREFLTEEWVEVVCFD